MIRKTAVSLFLTLLAAAPISPAANTPAAGGFDSFGVVPTPPPASAGWKRILEGGTGHIARWAHYDPNAKADSPKVDSIVVLEMEPAKGRTAEQYATALATRLKGTSVKDPVLMGGQPTFRITGERQPGMPITALISSNGNYIYVISGFGDTPALLPTETINTLATTLKFIPLAQPSANTAPRGEKFPLFNQIKIEPLDSMRPDPSPPAQGQIAVSTFNFAAGKPDFLMNVQCLPNSNGITLDQLKQVFPGKLNPEASVTWTPTKSAVPSVLSSTFDAKNEAATQKTRLALYTLPAQNQIVMIFFSFPNTDPQALAAYESAAEKIAASLEPLTP